MFFIFVCLSSIIISLQNKAQKRLLLLCHGYTIMKDIALGYFEHLTFMSLPTFSFSVVPSFLLPSLALDWDRLRSGLSGDLDILRCCFPGDFDSLRLGDNDLSRVLLRGDVDTDRSLTRLTGDFDMLRLSECCLGDLEMDLSHGILSGDLDMLRSHRSGETDTDRSRT